ncbi:MAG TPA: phosphate ABC transporter permease PstA [Spirochaetota bacterium]|nr:phosphate ABC transporter permease PstA [Spirochaetota bacterium]HPN82079.1 phosphate ABC transporter permease PstA [Spirochaetota bacterium]
MTTRCRQQQQRMDRTGRILVTLATGLVLSIMILILTDLLIGGAGSLSWEFVSDMPRDRMTAGGILPCIVGTLAVTLVTTLFSIPFGLATAIYLHEYAKDNRSTRLIRLAIRNLAGVPSIVYGIFGVALFVNGLALGTSILSAGLTLGLLTIPWTITASEEALRSVPLAWREASLALGATRWTTIRRIVLPRAVPGIITGGILGIARAAGETAPLLFTGASFSLPGLPESVFEPFMALPYHIYTLATQHESISQVRPIAYGTSLVLIGMILGLSLIAIIIRARLRRQHSGAGA